MQPVETAEVWCPKCQDYVTAPATEPIPPTAPPESAVESLANSDSASLSCGHPAATLRADDTDRVTRLKMKVARKAGSVKQATSKEERERHQSDKEALHEQINELERPRWARR